MLPYRSILYSVEKYPLACNTALNCSGKCLATNNNLFLSEKYLTSSELPVPRKL